MQLEKKLTVTWKSTLWPPTCPPSPLSMGGTRPNLFKEVSSAHYGSSVPSQLWFGHGRLPQKLREAAHYTKLFGGFCFNEIRMKQQLTIIWFGLEFDFWQNFILVIHYKDHVNKICWDLHFLLQHTPLSLPGARHVIDVRATVLDHCGQLHLPVIWVILGHLVPLEHSPHSVVRSLPELVAEVGHAQNEIVEVLNYRSVKMTPHLKRFGHASATIGKKMGQVGSSRWQWASFPAAPSIMV